MTTAATLTTMVWNFGGNAKEGVAGVMPKGPKILSVDDRGLRSV